MPKLSNLTLSIVAIKHNNNNILNKISITSQIIITAQVWWKETGVNFSSTEHLGVIVTSKGGRQDASTALPSDFGLHVTDPVHG